MNEKIKQAIDDHLDRTKSNRCRECGCTNEAKDSCRKKLGEPCYWISYNLCSACEPHRIVFHCSMLRKKGAQWTGNIDAAFEEFFKAKNKQITNQKPDQWDDPTPEIGSPDHPFTASNGITIYYDAPNKRAEVMYSPRKLIEQRFQAHFGDAWETELRDFEHGESDWYDVMRDIAGFALAVQSQKRELEDAANKLVHLHMCEQEGLTSGQPTPGEWIQTVDDLASVLLKNKTE